MYSEYDCVLVLSVVLVVIENLVKVRRREGGEGSRVGAGEDTRNISAHHRNNEGQMFESFKTPETWICYSGQWQHGLSDGAPGMSGDITPPFCPSFSHLSFAYTGTWRVQLIITRSLSSEEKTNK